MLTCFQISNTEYKNGISILNGAESVSKTCKQAPFKSHRPSAFRYDNSTTTLGCGWDSTSLGLRMTASLVTVVIAGASFYLTVIRKSKLVYPFAILLLVCAAAFGWFTYKDSSSVDVSRKWCNGNLKGVKFAVTPKSVTCDYDRFIFVCVLDAAGAVFWLCLTVFTVLVKKDLPEFLSGGSEKGKKKSQLKKPLVSEDGAGAPGAEADGSGDVLFPDGPDEDEKKGKKEENDDDDSYNVDFDEESKKRFPPTSKKPANQEPDNNVNNNNNAAPSKGKVVVSDGDIDFSQIEPDDHKGPEQKKQPPAQPPKPQPQPPKQKPAPAPSSNGDFDFESYVPED